MMPHPGKLWRSFDFVVPSQLPAMPPRWGRLGECGSLTDDELWNKVITGVDRLSFFAGDPDLIYIFQVWDVGIDNPRITWTTPAASEP
jgi:hypothetical protein